MSSDTATLAHATIDKMQAEWHIERSRLTNEKESFRREVHYLRQYIDGQMREHFQSYNGGKREQLHRLAELRLPLPFVPCGISGFNDAGADLCGAYDPAYSTITYVEERRMVPIRQAGRV